MEDVNRQIQEMKKPEEDKGIARVRSANNKQRYSQHQQKTTQQETQKCKKVGIFTNEIAAQHMGKDATTVINGTILQQYAYQNQHQNRNNL